MHPLEKETLKTVRQEQLIQAGDRILIGVSGGPDSMALLHVLARLAPDLNITPAAAYVNHGLRPEETREEKNLVETAANSLGVDFFTASVDVKGLAAKQKSSIEHAARILRYDFFEKTAEEWGATKIAVAHTADDQAEEILLRLIRGTARKGLSGMKTIRDGRIIRPFLGFPKSRLLEYLDKNSIRYLLDSSNTEKFYLRNRIRNGLLPYLTENFNPDIRQTLLRTANILQDEEELLENFTESAFKETVSINPMCLEKTRTDIPRPDESNNQELFLNLEHFSREPRAIQRRLLEKCCWEMGCEPRSRQIVHLLELAIKNAPEGTLHLSDGLRVIRNNELLCFTYPRGRGSFRGNISNETETVLPETSIRAPGVYEFPQLGKILVLEHFNKTVTDSKEVFSPGEHLDSSLFSFPLTLRGPMPGDRFHPLGAPGSKKVSDFLSDQKVERHARGQVPVLCADETIIALPGLRIDNRYKVTEKTTRIVRVCWEEID
ncbi:tRNA lysidine(34) synthetase TilS [Thermodesulfobacteriota bacterium]